MIESRQQRSDVGIKGPSIADGGVVSAFFRALPERNRMSETLQPSRPETDQEWEAKLERYVAKARPPEALEQGEILQLPLWPEPQRAAPSALLRSALFGVVRSGRRRFINGETLLEAWKGSSIRFKGEQLDQYDLDVWLQALHMARQQDLSGANGTRFTARSFLRAMGRRYSGKAARMLFKSLERMVACAVTIKVGDVRYVGSLVESFVQHEPSERYVLRLNPHLSALFGTGNTRMDWTTRLALSMDLARWMHGYVLSHQATAKAPHRIAVATLRDLSGSGTAALRNFRLKLRQAMNALAQMQVVAVWRLTDGDALEFVRFGTLTKGQNGRR